MTKNVLDLMEQRKIKENKEEYKKVQSEIRKTRKSKKNEALV